MSNKDPQISIVIVNYNVLDRLIELLDSIQGSAFDRDKVEIIIVDNASTDGTVAYLEEHYPYLTVIANKRNKGFGSANNQAAIKGRGKYLFFLNPDTRVQRDTLSKLHNYLEENRDPQIIGCGCQIRTEEGELAPESKRRFPSVRSIMSKSIKVDRLGAWPTTASYYDRISLRENSKVEVLSGCCMMIEKRHFLELGGFDEQFFLFGEDVDLCYRIYEAGYELGYTADTYITHAKGQSTQQNEFRYLWHFYRSAYLYAVKHHHRSHSSAFKLIIISGAVIHATAKFIRRKLSQSKKLALRLFF